MTFRKVCLSIVFAAFVLSGCKKPNGEEKDKEKPNLIQVGNQLMVGVLGKDGKRYYMKVDSDTWLCEGGKCIPELRKCPTCAPCDCRIPACSPWCYPFPPLRDVVIDPKLFPGLDGDVKPGQPDVPPPTPPTNK